MSRSTRPSEDVRDELKRRVTADGRGYDAIAESVGIKGPTLHRFLNTPGSGCAALPRLLKMFGFDDIDGADLDDEQRELLRAFEAARDAGRDGRALVTAFKTLTGVPEKSASPAPPKSRGSS